MPFALPAAATALAAAPAAVTAAATSAAATASLTSTLVSVASQVALNMAVSAVMSAISPQVGAAGRPVEWTLNPDGPIPFAFGRVGVAGSVIHKRTFGPDKMYYGFVSVLSGAGPIKRFVSFTADDVPVQFDGLGKAVTSEWAGELWRVTRRGHQPDLFLPTPTGLKNDAQLPYWNASAKTSGKALSMLVMGENSKRTAFPNGEVKPLEVIEGLFCWDPRQDSTWPGGSGACRLNDPDTWVWSENPMIFALKWALGLWEGAVGKGAPQVDQQVGGIGAKLSGIDVPALIAAANVCDANDWKGAAYPTTDDDKHQVLVSFMQAAGAVYTQRAGKISCIQRAAPRASVVTITADDVVGALEIDTAASRIDRINTIRPRYWSPEHRWQLTAINEVTAEAYRTEDGGKRTRGIDYPYVTDATQAAQLAALDIANTREGIAGIVPLKPHLQRIRPGDAFTISEPGFVMDGVKCLCLNTDYDPATGIVSVTFVSETDEKYAFALGQSPVVPSPPVLTPSDPTVSPPLPEDWVIEVRPPAPGGGQVPGFDLAGVVSNATATAVLVEWWQVPAETPEALPPEPDPENPDAPDGWTQAYHGPPNVTRIPIEGVQPGASYYVGIRYFRGSNGSVRYVYGPYVAPPLVSNDTTHVGGRPVGEIPGLDTVPPGVPTDLTLSSTSVTDSAGNPYARIAAVWTAPADLDVAGYDVEVTESGFTVVDRVTDAAWGREGLAGRNYTLRVRAVDLAGNRSDWTDAESVTGAGDTTAPAAPTGPAVSASLGAFFLSWTNASASDLGKVEVWEHTSNASGSATKIATVNAQAGAPGSYSRSGFSAGATRYYWLKSVDTSGNVSGFSAVASGTIPAVPTTELDTTPPGLPTGLSLSTSTAPHPATGQPVPRVVATWTGPGDSDLDSFDVEWTEGGGSPVVNRVGTARDEFVPALPGVTYGVRVRALDRVGNASAWTTSASIAGASDTTAPGAPTSFALTFSLTSAFLRWTAPSDADVSSVEVWSNSSNTIGTATREAIVPAVPGLANGWTKAGLTSGQTIYFWIRSVDWSGNRSSFTAVQSGTVPSVQVTDFASSIRPVELMTMTARLGATPALGRTVFDTTVMKLFRGTGSDWTAATDGADIVANSITGGQIAAGAINTAQLAAGAVTAAIIGADQINASHIATGAITTTELAAGAVTTVNLAAGAVTANEIAAGAVTAVKIAANVITSVHIAADSIDASRLKIGARGTAFDRLNFTTSGNTLSWEVGRVSYIDDAGNVSAYDIAAGSYAYSASGGDVTYVYWTKGAGTLSTTKSPGVAMANNAIIVATYYGGTNVTATYGRTIIDGDYIKAGTVTTGRLAAGAVTTAILAAGAVTANEIAAGAVTTTKLAAGAVTADIIAAGAVSADKFSTSGSVPAIWTMGSTGLTVQSAAAYANDPAGRINEATTLVEAGRIRLTGATALSSWLHGPDQTLINGGSIAANTIDANRLRVGARGVSFDRFNFTTSGNTLSWTTGRVIYVNDAGTVIAGDVASGSYAYTATGGDVTYVYWVKDASTLSTTKSAAVAMGANAVVVGAYYGSNLFTATYGRTVIDGDFIKTLSIQTVHLAAGSVTAAKISVTDLSAISAALGTVTTGLLRNTVGTFAVNADLGVLVNFTGSYMKVIGSGFGASSNLDEWYGPKPSGATLADPKLSTLTTTNGAWAMAGGTIYYGSAPLDPGGGGGDLTVNTNFGQTVGGSGYNSISGSSWQVLAQATLTSVVSGQLISASLDWGLVNTSGGTFNGEVRLRQGASTVLGGPDALSLVALGSNDPINYQATASATGTVTYYLEARQTSGATLEGSSGGAFSFSRYAIATTSQAGMMSPAQVAALEAGGGGGGVSLATTAPPTVGTSNAVGTGTTAARADHVHAHGDQAGGSLHAVATTSAAGFMSAAQVVRLNSTFTQQMTSEAVVGGGAIGSVVLVPGNGTNSGYVSFRAPTTGTEIAYIGYGAGSTILVQGAAVEFSHTPRVGANTVYHAGNLTPVVVATSGTPAALGTAARGTSADAARADHVHAHGNQAGGSLHSVATSSTAGFIPAADKAALDARTSGATANTIVTRNASGESAFSQVSSTNGFNLGFRTITANSTNLEANCSWYAQSFIPTSDARWKRDISGLERGLDAVLQLQPRQYRWRESGDWTFGLIAQEVDAVFPEAVWVSEDGRLGLEYDILTAPIIKAIHDLHGLVQIERAEKASLAAEVGALSQTVEALASRLAALEAA